MEIASQITRYLSSLDWEYIITFIVIAYGINHSRVTRKLRKTIRIKSKTRYRTTLIGVLYGVALYFIRGSELAQIERLFQSFVFAIVFHKLIIDGVIKYIGKKVSSSNKVRQSKEYYGRFDDPPHDIE